MNEWISLHDELPEENIVIIVCDNISGFVSFAKFFEETNEFELMYIDKIEGDSNITHWMPLPSPPDIS